MRAAAFPRRARLCMMWRKKESGLSEGLVRARELWQRAAPGATGTGEASARAFTGGTRVTCPSVGWQAGKSDMDSRGAQRHEQPPPRERDASRRRDGKPVSPSEGAEREPVSGAPLESTPTDETVSPGQPDQGVGVARAAAAIFVACICGWLVMQLEILGGRVLIPYFGSAVYVVMGSVIGVFLLSLSGGYLLGGWLSNRRRSRHALGVSLVAAGVWLCALPTFIEPVCSRIVETGLDDKWGSLTAGFLLFAAPTVLLGTVSPTVVRWVTTRARDSGRNAGLVLAFSTLASFGGCVVTAFYLVLLSVRLTILVSGVILLALGAAVLLSAALTGRTNRPA